MARQENRRDGGNRNPEGKGNKETQVEPECSTDESSGEQYEALKQPEQMELKMDSIYKVHEQIQLEWPSLTVCMGEEEGQVLIEQTNDQNKSSILDLHVNLSAENTTRNAVRQKGSASTPAQVNRIRAANGKIFAITDKSLHIYNKNLQPELAKQIKGGYAISTYKTSLFYGDGDQIVSQQNISIDSVEQIKMAHPEIYAASAVSLSSVFAATKYVDLVDFRSNDIKNYLKSSVDVNALGYNGDNLIVAGDDAGKIHLIDMRKEQVLETIIFHQSPVTNVQFSSSEIFASSSSCEVVIWDMGYEETEEWEYHKYLSFVHQGQSYYKDFEFINDDLIIATSENGLCIFSPQLEIKDE